MHATEESYLASDRPAVFLRLETARERLALPYSTLLGISISMDGTILSLDFASHEITVKGKRLYEVFCSISAGLTQALFTKSETEEFSHSSMEKIPVIREVRIKPAKSESEN